MRRLAKAGTMDKSAPVSCHLRGERQDDAELSLAENVVRIAMHPADQFEAWRGLIENGAGVPDIAALEAVGGGFVRGLRLDHSYRVVGAIAEDVVGTLLPAALRLAADEITRPSVKVRCSLMAWDAPSQPAVCRRGTTNFRQVSASVFTWSPHVTASRASYVALATCRSISRLDVLCLPPQGRTGFYSGAHRFRQIQRRCIDLARRHGLRQSWDKINLRCFNDLRGYHRRR
jgi:hypothetical protein